MEIDQSESGHGAAPASPGVVSEDQAKAFLIDRFGRDVSSVSSIGQGEWSKAYAFCHASLDYIIRFSALDEDFAKDRLAARYGSPALPIPPILEIGEAFRGFYAISERRSGGYLDDLDGGQMRATLPPLFAALDAARLVDLSESTGFGGWGADGIAPYPTWRSSLLSVADDRPTERTHGWRNRLAAFPARHDQFEEAVGHLRDLVDRCPDERYLIHSDLLHFNVLVANDRITAVLDWGCSMYGDFLYDIAWFCFFQPWYPAWNGIDFRRETERHYQSIGLDVPDFDARLRCCQVHIGLAGLAYCAFRHRWEDFDAVAKRTLEVARPGR